MNRVWTLFWYNPYVLAACLVIAATPAIAAEDSPRYFAHSAETDRHGVIAPWYRGLNGQCDFRARVAAETLKRYPWTSSPITGRSAPDYMYNGRWAIAADGTITPGELTDWGNGDLVQRASYSIFGWLQYYQYSGDPAAIAHVWMLAELILDQCQTGSDHPWPNFVISVPNSGQPYGPCDAHGMIQLDLAAMAGVALVRSYEMTGNRRWLDAARHWADVFAEMRNREPGLAPWNRYANPQDVFWADLQTGGVVLILQLFEELLRVGPAEDLGHLREARDAGLAYVHDVLLEDWTRNDVWGRDYWDWVHDVQSESLSEMIPRYMMRNPNLFPQWRGDARNIFSLFLMRACVAPESGGGVYSGAWAYPEGAQCCGRSLSYPPMQVAAAFAEYGVRTNDEWAREMARRQLILATYDAHETGVVEDGMDGGQVAAGGWLQVAHPLPLAYVLDAIGWLPESLGANRENHLVRCSSVVRHIRYEDGRITWETFDAPADTISVLRLAFKPERVSVDGGSLRSRTDLDANGYILRNLPNGDCVVSIRHDGLRSLTVEGDDPQAALNNEGLTYNFEGNQVRVIGSVGAEGGLADVYLDGAKQLCGIDCWNPYDLREQVLWYRNGLTKGPHTLRIVPRNVNNPLSEGTRVSVSGIQFSAAEGDAGSGEGGGPRGEQRWIFGYPGRKDYVDARGAAWKPAAEVVIRVGQMLDPVETAWHATPRRLEVAGTPDPTLYRHGMHGRDFTAYFTVGPGTYHLRLKFMETRLGAPETRGVNIDVNGRPWLRDMDIAATAAGRPAAVRWVSPNGTKVWEGLNRAVDLVLNDIEPVEGMIAVRFFGGNGGEAIVSAAEIGPGPGGAGAMPIPIPTATRPHD